MSLTQITSRLQTTELLLRNQDKRITTLEYTKPTVSTILRTDNNANQQSISNLNSISSNSLSVQNNITSLNNGQLLGFSNIDTHKTSSGIIRSNTNLNILTFAVPTNTTGYIKGSVISGKSDFDFEIYCKNVNNTVSIIATTFKGFTINNDALTFSYSGVNILMSFHNNQSINQKYLLKYSNNFIGN